MLYRKGNAESLLAVGNEFIDFLQHEDNTNFSLLNNRFDSFYGTTFGVEVNNTDKFYMSMEYREVDVTKTYQSFINDYGSYCSELIDYTKTYGGELLSKYGIRNIFTDNGEFIAFGLHTMYDSGLWLCEQGGINCEKESHNQIYGLNLLPIAIRYAVDGGTIISDQTIPYIVYPGLGLPLLTISESNKLMYDVEVRGINYFFTSDSYNATITIMIENGGANPPLWQSICFGQLNCPESFKYSLPLYIGGGSQGLKQDYHYCPAAVTVNGVTTDTSQTFYGNSITLDMYNPCLSNSSILYSTKFNKATASNFRVMSPSGVWDNIYSYVQDTQDKKFTLNGDVISIPPKNRPSFLYAPTNFIEESFLHVNSGGNGNLADVYSITEPSEFGYSVNKIDCSIIPISIFGHNCGHQGFYGSIPDLYSISSKSILGGEIELNGIKYLCIPCGWDYRQKLYSDVPDVSLSYSLGKVVNTRTIVKEDVFNESLVQYYDNIHNIMRNNYLTDKILIKLE